MNTSTNTDMEFLVLLLVAASGNTLAHYAVPVSYNISVSTGWSDHAGTSRPNASLIISGTNGITKRLYLSGCRPPDFEKGSLHSFENEATDVGQIRNITFSFNIWGQDDRWFLEDLFIRKDSDSGQIYAFALHTWMHKETTLSTAAVAITTCYATFSTSGADAVAVAAAASIGGTISATKYTLSDPCVMSSCTTGTGSSCHHVGFTSEVYTCTCNSSTTLPLCSTESKCQYNDGWFHPEGSGKPDFRCHDTRLCQHPSHAAILESTQELMSVAQCMCQRDVSGFFARLKVNKGTQISQQREDCDDSLWCSRWRHCLRKETFSRAYCSKKCGYCEKGWITLDEQLRHSYRLVSPWNNDKDLSCVVSCDDFDIRVCEVGCFGANEFDKPVLCKSTLYGNDNDFLSCLSDEGAVSSPDPVSSRTSSTPIGFERTSVTLSKSAKPAATITHLPRSSRNAVTTAETPALPFVATTITRPTRLATIPESNAFTIGITSVAGLTASSPASKVSAVSPTSEILPTSSTSETGTAISSISVATSLVSSTATTSAPTPGPDSVPESAGPTTEDGSTTLSETKISFDHNACMELCASYTTARSGMVNTTEGPTTTPVSSGVGDVSNNNGSSSNGNINDGVNRQDHTTSTTMTKENRDDVKNSNITCFPNITPEHQNSILSITTEIPKSLMRTLVEDIHKELRVDVSSLSRTRSRKTSARDDRKSCQAAGYIAVVFLCAVALVIVQADLKHVYDTFKGQRGNSVGPSQSLA